MSRVLVLGASGMLGNAVARVLAASKDHDVFGSIRSEASRSKFPDSAAIKFLVSGSVEISDVLVQLFRTVRPDVVINCVGLVKQLAQADDPLLALPINSLLPHRLNGLCELSGARLVHISTDCVFSGSQGFYTESNIPDALDLYGRSKLIGEVATPNSITLRTSIIGHSLGTGHGLIDWFLSQKEKCSGYRRAIFSGLPTVELARIIKDVVLPHRALSGIFHVASHPISKYDLLCMVAEVYGKKIEIIGNDSLTIDRSLCADRFNSKTGYQPANWLDLVQMMHSDWGLENV